MPNDSALPVASPDPGRQLRYTVQNAIVHASIWHASQYGEASPEIATLCVLGMNPDVGDAALLVAAGHLLEALPDCREVCGARDDGKPGWTP